MKPSQKTIITPAKKLDSHMNSDFDKLDFDGAVRTKGNEVIFEKAYLCPCKSKESDHRSICKNCGGTGWFFCNPTRTEMVVTGVMSDPKLKAGALQQWGMLDSGSVKITSYDDIKLTFMDKVTIVDATAEHNLIVYPVLKDDGSQLFAYSKYDIVGIDYIALFDSPTDELIKLEETTDYTFEDNVIVFNSQYNDLVDPCVTIRYIHNPVFHIMEILRESMTSPAQNGTIKNVFPVHALGRRAHLITDIENFAGNRLLDNSWLPQTCETPDLSKFQRQIRYATAQTIYDHLTAAQKIALETLLSEDSI